MSSFRAFASYSCDGGEEFDLCDGTHHLKLFPGLFFDDEATLGKREECDGTCQPVDLRSKLLEQIEKVRGETIDVDTAILPSHVEISSEAQAVLAESEVVGVRLERWYAKSDGEGAVYCLNGGLHMRVSVSYDWWSGRNTSRYKTMTVEIVACGSDRGHKTLSGARVSELLSQAKARN